MWIWDATTNAISVSFGYFFSNNLNIYQLYFCQCKRLESKHQFDIKNLEKEQNKPLKICIKVKSRWYLRFTWVYTCVELGLGLFRCGWIFKSKFSCVHKRSNEVEVHVKGTPSGRKILEYYFQYHIRLLLKNLFLSVYWYFNKLFIEYTTKHAKQRSSLTYFRN